MNPDPTMNDSQRLVRIETLVEQMAGADSDHELRIRKLERWQWLATGLAGGIGGVLGQMAQSLFGGG